jgi:hypothetical protein
VFERHVVHRILKHADIAELFIEARQHLYQHTGLDVAEIVELLKDKWTIEDGVPTLSYFHHADWIIKWTFKDQQWQRHFSHRVPINKRRYACFLNESLSFILDRLIEIPVHALCSSKTQYENMVKANAKDKLNACYANVMLGEWLESLE